MGKPKQQKASGRMSAGSDPGYKKPPMGGGGTQARAAMPPAPAMGQARKSVQRKPSTSAPSGTTSLDHGIRGQAKPGGLSGGGTR